jgi:hypothetical protein
MRRFAGLLLLLAACGSGSDSRDRSEPPRPGDYPAWSNATANLGVGFSAVGAQLIDSDSDGKRAAGAGFSAAGGAGLAATWIGSELGARERERRLASDRLADALDGWLERQPDRFLPRPISPPPDTTLRGDSPLASPPPK